MTDGSFGSLVSLTLLALFAAGFALLNRRPPVFRFPLPRRPLSLSRVLAVLAASSLVAVGSVKPGSQPERLFHGALLRLESLLPTNSFPFGRATWPFDAPTAGVVSNLTAPGENAIPDAMLGTGLALCSVAAVPAPVGPASGFAVPHWLPFDADNRCVSAALPFPFPFGDATFDRVDIFVRREVKIPSAKLVAHIVDFDHPEQWADMISGDVLFSTLGTTIKAAGS